MCSEPFETTVLLFAGLRQRAGTDRIVVQLPAGAGIAELLAAVAAHDPALAPGLDACRVAVDQAFADRDTVLGPAQEIALIPPVSGGHDGPGPLPGGDETATSVAVRPHPLHIDAVIDAVRHPGAGGLTSFVGQVRAESRGKTIVSLEYEAYVPMAEAVMGEIAAAIAAERPGARVAIHHRIGRLEVGEIAVVIAASAPHRDAAFWACREAIERLKRDVPIWKKEIDTEGEAWLGQGP